MEDLICMKLSAIAGRGARRDFWDVHRMLCETRQPMHAALAMFRSKFASVDVGHVVRALAYFADADAEPMPAGLDEVTWEEMKADLRAWVLQVS